MAPRIHAAEALGPGDLFAQYAERVGMSDMARQLGAEVLAEGQKGGGRGGGQLDLHWVELTGFGPFRDSTRYNLAHGGLRCVVVGSAFAQRWVMRDTGWCADAMRTGRGLTATGRARRRW